MEIFITLVKYSNRQKILRKTPLEKHFNFRGLGPTKPQII